MIRLISLHLFFILSAFGQCGILRMNPVTMELNCTGLSGGGSSTPAGSTTQYQYNNAGAMGGATGALYSSTTEHSAFGADAVLDQNDIFGAAQKASVNVTETLAGTQTVNIASISAHITQNTSTFTSLQTVGLDLFTESAATQTGNFAGLIGRDSITQHQGAGTTSYIEGDYNGVYNKSVNNQPGLTGYIADVSNQANSNITNIRGIWNYPGQNTGSGTVTNAYANYCDSPVNGGGGTITNSYCYWAANPTPSGVTNYFAYHSSVNAAANRWAFYGAGTAASHLGGEIDALAFIGSGAIPAVTVCGTIGTGSKNAAGFITSATGACAPVLTFTVTATTGWSCGISNSTTPANIFQQTGSSATTATFTGVSAANDVLRYNCIAY